MSKKGEFIVIEGLDGSGNTTQARLLSDYLSKKKKGSVLLTKEPTNDFIGQYIRSFLKKKFSCPSAFKQILFAADRSCHLQESILPALERGAYVVYDRYIFSSIAYGGSEGLSTAWLWEINSHFLVPDMTFILRVDPKECIERINKDREEKEYFEEEEKLENVWKYYLQIRDLFPNTYIVEGEGPIDEVHTIIVNIIERRY